MNEKKKLILVLIILFTLVVTIIIAQVVGANKSNRIIKELEKLYKEPETNIIYIGRDGCSYCELFNPVIETMSQNYKIDYTYINTNNLTTKNLKQLLNLFNIDASKFGTPCLVITKDSNVVMTKIGYVNEVNLFNLFQENGIISKDITNPYLLGNENEEVASFNEVFNSKEKQIIYVGRPSCGYCQQFLPNLESVSDEYSLDYYYVNTDELESLELTTILYKLGLSSSSFGTPYLAIVENGEVINELPGYVEKDELIEFLEDSKLID